MSDEAQRRCEAPRSQRNPFGRRCQLERGHVGPHDWQRDGDPVPSRSGAADIGGWKLVPRETEPGQIAWSWSSGAHHDDGPQFSSEREAIDFMRRLDLLPPAVLDRFGGRAGDDAMGPGSTFNRRSGDDGPYAA